MWIYSISIGNAALAGKSLEFKFLFSVNLFALVIDTEFASPEIVGDFLISFTEQSVPRGMALLLWGYACNVTCQGLRNKD